MKARVRDPAALERLAADEGAMRALGARLARTRPHALQRLSIHLQGELGAGKTTLVRGLLEACGVTGAVRSPTYTLLETYATAALEVLHMDLYRLARPDELEALGLRDFDQSGWLWLIEWPERGAGYLPAADITATLAIGARGHPVHLTAGTAPGRKWLAALATSD